MTSFAACARQVRDLSLDQRVRKVQLRNCLFHFAPFGFRATWNSLVSTHRIPDHIAAHPASLVHALDELEAARALVAPRAAAFAALRRRQKRDGRRVPMTLHPWDSWGCHAIAYCPDPQRYPDESLPVVVGRVLEACASGAADPVAVCMVCGSKDRRPRRACPNCGVLPGGRSDPI
ncbi:hypothetical protein KOI35_18940 [Actinoplanes bogorensis]|uniref:Uncharacterized protein n=1 Tax=Paractinoplanes bogorensis TaxID=1610840 RepID=A0ABS5YQ59_9ACTN|nr:hypothetical protein [Actinoplanes bogorensis]MBU2665590.1 hypothetical protein [Actinoplanes bogorensis]